jgi:hypothetical protein
VLLQVLVEDLTGSAVRGPGRERVLPTAGMSESGYDDPPLAAPALRPDGRPLPYDPHRYAEMVGGSGRRPATWCASRRRCSSSRCCRRGCTTSCSASSSPHEGSASSCSPAAAAATGTAVPERTVAGSRKLAPEVEQHGMQPSGGPTRWLLVQAAAVGVPLFAFWLLVTKDVVEALQYAALLAAVEVVSDSAFVLGVSGGRWTRPTRGTRSDRRRGSLGNAADFAAWHLVDAVAAKVAALVSSLLWRYYQHPQPTPARPKARSSSLCLRQNRSSRSTGFGSTRPPRGAFRRTSPCCTRFSTRLDSTQASSSWSGRHCRRWPPSRARSRRRAGLAQMSCGWRRSRARLSRR